MVKILYLIFIHDYQLNSLLFTLFLPFFRLLIWFFCNCKFLSKVEVILIMAFYRNILLLSKMDHFFFCLTFCYSWLRSLIVDFLIYKLEHMNLFIFTNFYFPFSLFAVDHQKTFFHLGLRSYLSCVVFHTH